MAEDRAGWLLAGAAAVFVVVLLARLRAPRREREGARDALATARQRARRASTKTERAEAWSEASRIALDALDRPDLAITFGRRALRADSESADALDVLVRAFLKADRLAALERLLWRCLDAKEHGPGYERAFDALITLYEGRLGRPERAAVLRRLRARRGADDVKGRE